MFEKKGKRNAFFTEIRFFGSTSHVSVMPTERQHLLQQLESLVRRGGEDVRVVHRVDGFQVHQKLFHGSLVESFDVLSRRGADHVEDLHQLVGLRPELLAQLLAVLPLVASRAQREARLAGEERLGLHARLQGLQQLGEDAARRPHVDGGAVVLLHEDQLGGAVPASHHVLRQLTLRSRSHLDPRICNVAASLTVLLVLRTYLASQAKIDNFYVTLAIDENVGRLQVSMNDVPTLKIEQTTH